MNRRLATVVIETAVWVAVVVLASFLATGCIATPEGDYASDVDRQDCVVTVGLHATYTTGRVCPDRSDTFEGRWSLEGDTVHVTFDDGTAYDLTWDGDALVDGNGLMLRRAP